MNLLSRVANEVKKVRVSCDAGNIPELTLSHRPREPGAKTGCGKTEFFEGDGLQAVRK
jgi:hypothetical protein